MDWRVVPSGVLDHRPHDRRAIAQRRALTPSRDSGSLDRVKRSSGDSLWTIIKWPFWTTIAALVGSLVIRQRVDLVAAAIPGSGLVLTLLAVAWSKVKPAPRPDKPRQMVKAPPDAAPGELPGAPDRALIAEFLHARSTRRRSA